MLTWCRESLDERTLRFVILSDTGRLRWGEVLALWRDSAPFRTAFNELLAAAPFAAFRWETPPVAAGDMSGDFEFVLADSPELLTAADPSAFADHFRRAGSSPVVTFRNLGGDAELIAPCSHASEAYCSHLGAFVRGAPEAQRHALWEEVSRALERRLGQRPVWLSTAGGGVAWLHVRLDDRPKYYVHGPYRLYRPRGEAAGESPA